MDGRFPRLGSRLRIFVPLAVLVMILGGVTAVVATGAFESHDSGFDSARDVAERGTVASSTTTTSLPAVSDDNGVADPVSRDTDTRPGRDQYERLRRRDGDVRGRRSRFGHHPPRGAARSRPSCP